MSAWTSSVEATPGGWTWPDSVPDDSAFEDAPDSSPLGTDEEVKHEPTPPDSGSAGEGSEPHVDPEFQKHWHPRTCRICLEQVLPSFHLPNETLPGFLAGRPYVKYESESGRLIRPCKCKGSSRYVHDQCLQQWRHSDRSYTSARHYWQCPTCGFRYRLQRLTWARYVSSAASQVTLTLLVFLVAVFVLGFIGDFIINLYLDPVDLIASATGVYDVYDEYDDASWTEHFIKGFASLGILGFLKAMLANPVNWFNLRLGGGRRTGNTGRDRVTNQTWIFIIAGAGMVFYAVWKATRAFCRRVLERAGESVLDVQGADTGDDEVEENTVPNDQTSN